MVDPLYQIKVECPLCKSHFETSRVRPSFKKVARSDSDFCNYYTTINPDYYVVRVCPECGYAFTEKFQTYISPASRQRFLEEYTPKWTKKDFGGKRTWEDALNTYKLALVCAQIKEEPMRIRAGLLHHIAWMYRYRNETELEHQFLRHALEAYRHMYETEHVEVDEARLMYLIGELNRRLGNLKEAVQWFSRVVHDKKIMNAHMIQLSREQWKKVREEMREKGNKKL